MKNKNLNKSIVFILVFFILTFSNVLLAQVANPNGGENGEFWSRNSTKTITWDTPGFAAKVHIYLWNINTSSYTQIANAVNNTGSYNWTIPTDQQIGNFYRIKIVKKVDTTVYSMSTTFFPIYDEGTGGNKLGVDENTKNTFSIEVFPNPASREITFRWNTESKAVRLVIYNSIGNPVFDESNLPDKVLSVNTKSLPSGVYNVKLVLENYQILNKKLIISK